MTTSVTEFVKSQLHSGNRDAEAVFDLVNKEIQSGNVRKMRGDGDLKSYINYMIRPMRKKAEQSEGTDE